MTTRRVRAPACLGLCTSPELAQLSQASQPHMEIPRAQPSTTPKIPSGSGGLGSQGRVGSAEQLTASGPNSDKVQAGWDISTLVPAYVGVKSHPFSISFLVVPQASAVHCKATHSPMRQRSRRPPHSLQALSGLLLPSAPCARPARQ